MLQFLIITCLKINVLGRWSDETRTGAGYLKANSLWPCETDTIALVSRGSQSSKPKCLLEVYHQYNVGSSFGHEVTRSLAKDIKPYPRFLLCH